MSLPGGWAMYRYMLGYDIRLCLEDYGESAWDEERRNRLLPKRDVVWPLSVDRSIWPSVFTSHRRLANDEKLILIVGDYFHYDMFHLWDDIERMKSRFVQCEDDVPRQGVVIAAELHLIGALESDINWDTHWKALTSADPAMGSVPKNWISLGYDVATVSMFYSGLCGYAQPKTKEWEPERERWASRLNDHGLFSNFDDALEYTLVPAEWDENEAPFYVYALYRDPELLKTE